MPFDWELVDGRIVVKGQPRLWHNDVRDGIADALKAARTKPCRVLSEQCVMVDEQNVVKPDVIVFDPRNLDYFEVECIPTSHLTLVVEVVSPVSRQVDRVSKHEYWLNADTLTYIPAPIHPVHHGKLITELPFPVEIDLAALVGF
ncbi:Uma2 family endonuclease [Streptomyces sp. NPDC051985]|uniref:Uma2 family endonuclease n=1 Tax=Streptomyces sp. NPDC051985 TaxID=3155807 RepID=UPI003415BF47